TGGGQIIEIEPDVEVFGRQHRSGESARNERLEPASFPDAAADVEDQFAGGDIHRELVVARTDDVAAHRVATCTGRALRPPLLEPLRSVAQDHWKVRQRLDVVDNRGLAPQPLDGR